LAKVLLIDEDILFFRESLQSVIIIGHEIRFRQQFELHILAKAT